MAKRRTNQEIQEVAALAQATWDTARDIRQRVNGDEEGDAYVHVSAANIGGVKAEYQRGHAKVIMVSYNTKDPILAERVAKAIRAELLAAGVESHGSEPHVVGTDASTDENDPAGRYPRCN